MDRLIKLTSTEESEILVNRKVNMKWSTPSEYFTSLNKDKLELFHSIDSRPFSLNNNVRGLQGETRREEKWIGGYWNKVTLKE